MSKLKQVNIRVTEQQLQIILDGYAKSKFQTQRDYVLSLISAGLKVERERGAIMPTCQNKLLQVCYQSLLLLQALG